MVNPYNISYDIEYPLGETVINDILIVGDSDTSFQFTRNLQEFDTFSRVIHVIKSSDAIKIMIQRDFSIIVIDSDAEGVDSIALSNIVRSNLPLSRIVVISNYYSIELIKSMINQGSVDALIPIPIDPYTGTSLIIEQHSKYLINQTLYNLITVDPPKFSPSYYFLHDPNLRDKIKDEIKFVGFVIIYSSLTKYSKFYSEDFRIDEYLITGYISAISLLGQQLFQQNSFFKEINFGGLSVIMHNEDDIQYLFFFEDLTKSGYQIIETEMDRIVKGINNEYFEQLRSEFPTTNELDQEIEQIIDNFDVTQRQMITEERKQNVILFGNQLPKLNSILSKRKKKYNITRYFNSQDVIDHLFENETDILVINQILDGESWNFNLASQAKDINPSIQIVALLKKLSPPNLLKILNDDYLDYVLSYNDSPKEIESNLDLAFSKAIKIKKELINYTPHNVQQSLHSSVIVRSMLRSFNSTFQISNIPEFYGLFIMQADLPYYSNIWSSDRENIISFDEQLFAGFVSSMEMFTNEIFETQQEFSGFQFGDITILIRHHFEFAFVFFMSNIDHTNSLMINRQIEITSNILFNSIINSEGFFDYDPDVQFDITPLIDQLLLELHLRLTSLNFI